MFNDCPLIHSFYGQACFILSGEEGTYICTLTHMFVYSLSLFLSHTENKSIRKELLNSAIRSLENALRIAGWAEMDETVYILATVHTYTTHTYVFFYFNVLMPATNYSAISGKGT